MTIYKHYDFKKGDVILHLEIGRCSVIEIKQNDKCYIDELHHSYFYIVKDFKGKNHTVNPFAMFHLDSEKIKTNKQTWIFGVDQLCEFKLGDLITSSNFRFAKYRGYRIIRLYPKSKYFQYPKAVIEDANSWEQHLVSLSEIMIFDFEEYKKDLNVKYYIKNLMLKSNNELPYGSKELIKKKFLITDSLINRLLKQLSTEEFYEDYESRIL